MIDCAEVRRLVDAELDGELDAAHALDVERHVAGCAWCRALVARRQALRQAVRGAGLAVAAPAALVARVQSAVRTEAGLRGEPKIVPEASRTRRWTVPLALAAALALGFALARLAPPRASRDAAARAEVVSAHLRSLQPGHLLDVASTDRHTVKPWFSGKLDFAPPVVDLADAGFPLEGGRLDALDGRPAAALVYRRRKHVVNVFVTPEHGSRSPESSSSRGYNVVRWCSDGISWWAVSDLSAAELETFAAELRARTATGRS